MKNICLGFLAETVILSVVVLGWFAIFGNTPETYPDVIIEWTAITGNNKSTEMHLVWLLVFLTILLTAGLHCFLKKESDTVALGSRFFRNDNYLATAFFAYILLFFLVYHHWVVPFCCAAVLAVIAAKWRKDCVWEAVIGSLVGYYALFGLTSLVEWVLPVRLSVRAELLALLSFLSVLALLKMRPRLLGRYLSAAQVLVPLGLLSLLTDRYLYQGQEYVIQNPWQATGIILAVVVVAACFIYRKERALAKSGREHVSLDERISLWACAVIYALSQYYPNGLAFVTDPHHPIENIIGFSQIFELGQAPFTEYTPVSGMYSIVHGLAVYLFGNDQLANYGIATNIVMIGISGLTIYLLRNLVARKREVFLFAILFSNIAIYNRIWFIFPVIFLLMQPGILKSPVKMIMTWLLTSCFLGLYYPLYGAAACLGFVPVVIYHIISVWKAGSFRLTRKNVIPWGITACLLLLSLPLLYGLAVHMKAMGSQTVWADGLAAFAQMPPSWFLLFFKSLTLRLAAFEILRFVFPMAPLAMGTWFLCSLFQRYRATREVRVSEMTLAALMISVPVVSFSYTFVRFDFDQLFARLVPPLNVAIGVFFLYGIRHLAASAKKICIVITVICAAMLGQAGQAMSGFGGSLANDAIVPEDEVYVDREFPKSGEGFMPASYYKDVQAYTRYAGASTPMFGLPYFSKWYLLAIPGTSTLEATTLKGYSAAEETVRILKDQKPLIGMDVNSYETYYLYHWIVTSGVYRYSAEDGLFIPQQEMDASDNKEIPLPVNAGERHLHNAPEATGLSIETLRKNFATISVNPEVAVSKESDEKTEIVWNEAMDGDKADFAYIELEIEHPTIEYGTHKWGNFQTASHMNAFSKYLMLKKYNPGKILRVSWQDDAGAEHAFQMDFGQGKLLVPLGAGTGWLRNQHDRITLECLEDGNPVPLKAVKHVELLKLRTVE